MCPSRGRVNLTLGKEPERAMSASTAQGASLQRPADAGISAESDPSPAYQAPRARFLEFRQAPGPVRSAALSAIGLGAFFLVWQLGHSLTSEVNQKFLPSPVQVLTALYTLFAENDFLADVLKSCYRVFASFETSLGPNHTSSSGMKEAAGR